MIYTARSNIGKIRERNEDSFFIPSRADDYALVVVADGMGGLNGGEAASRITVEAVVEWIGNNYDMLPAKLMQSAAIAANEKVMEKAKLNGEDVLMGSTLTLAIIKNQQLFVGNVGDSRAYVFDGEKLDCITRDHTYVDGLVRAGELTRQQAKHHPQRHMITRAIGIRKKLQTDVFERPWLVGGTVLICSDGLTNHVEDCEIEQVLLENQDIEEAADKLIQKALDSGGQDNITLVIAKDYGKEDESL